MNREDINKLWGEAYVNGMLPFEQREKFARLVAAAEREACAKICDENGDKWADGNDEWRNGQATASYYCAIAIRARGER